MEELGVIPEELVKKFVEWSVYDVYTKWELFAVEVSAFAYELAIERARAESDAKIAQMHEFISLIKAHNRETGGKSKEIPVYIPKLEEWR